MVLVLVLVLMLVLVVLMVVVVEEVAVGVTLRGSCTCGGIRVVVLGIGRRVYACCNARVEAVDVAGAPVLADSEAVAPKTSAQVVAVQDAFEAHGAAQLWLVVVGGEDGAWYTRHC